MDSVKRALWHIERRIGEPPTLEGIAREVGLSRFHLSRIFGEVTGRSFSAHVRGRRLSEAARQLAAGAPDILSVAIEAGYGSHEAFSRAFRDQFGLTPERLRLRAELSSLMLVEPILMPDTPIAIEEPEIRSLDALLLAGLRQFFTYEERGGIPLLWQRFGPHIGTVPDQIHGTAYGVCIRSDDARSDGFDYLAAVPVRSLDRLGEGLVGVRLPPLSYAVFQHRGHIAGIGATCAAAGEWLGREGRAHPSTPVMMVEYYGPDFDPVSGLGGCEVWVPVRD